MSFHSRIMRTAGKPPIRAYLHKKGIEVFGANPAQNAADHLVKSIEKSEIDFTKFQFILANMRGCGDYKITDIFAFEKSKWKNPNPEISLFVLKDGVYMPNQPPMYGLGSDMLSAEIKWRQESKSFKQYLNEWPSLEDCEPDKLWMF